jgi:hypothetical protein
LGIRVNDTDKEGYFSFSGLSLRDRANNQTLISHTDFPNAVWIDPVAPVVSVSEIIVSGVTTATPSSGIVVSGLIDLEFNVVETTNDITSGLVYYSGVITGSGLPNGFPGVIPPSVFSSGLWNEVQSGTTTANDFTFRYQIQTEDLVNGEYLITIYSVDYAGNKSEFEFTFVVNNDLILLDVLSIIVPGSGLRTFEMVFNTYPVLSGLSAVDGVTTLDNIIKFEMISVTTNTTFTQTQTGITLTGYNGSKIIFNLPEDIIFNIPSPYFIRVTILTNKDVNFADYSETKIVSGSLVVENPATP